MSLLRTATRAVPALSSGAIASRGFASSAVSLKHSLPDLPYSYDALEPHIATKIMELHHGKHHNTYVTNLNAAEEALSNALSKNDVKGTIASQAAIKFNGGGE